MPLLFNARGSSDVFTDGVTEVRANSLVGCFVIRYAGSAQNAGSLDAMTLSARMESINTDLLAKVVAANSRTGLSVRSVTNPALGSRTVVPNPFGNDVPVECLCEIFHDTLQKWVATPWNAISGTGSTGINAFYSEGEGIVLRVGTAAYVAATNSSGTSQELVGDYKTPSAVRI